MLAGHLFNVPVSGTQAHAYVQSFSSLDELTEEGIQGEDGGDPDFVKRILRYRGELNYQHSNDGELASFIAYAQAFPNGFLALVDTYDTLRSGIPNSICVGLALAKAGFKPLGVRLDSGDLSYLSKETRKMFQQAGKRYDIDLTEMKIVASNEINEETLRSLNQQGHNIDIFGIGTHLVTCQAQPSLGCVYKLVEIKHQPRIKLSQESSKITIPGRKQAFRLFGEQGWPLADLMMQPDEAPPETGERILCCHPYEEKKRTYVVPSRVERLHDLYWDGKPAESPPSLAEARDNVVKEIKSLRADHLRMLNPTPYKVSLSRKLYDFTHRLWLDEAPLAEMR
jgi:nicotinate phosphoribosyltransferase